MDVVEPPVTARPPAQRTPGRDPASAGNSGAGATADAAARSEGATPPEARPPPFARFFRYPQYAWRHAVAREDGVVAVEDEASCASAVANVEVGLVVDAHASLRVMAPRRPRQLLRLVAGVQALGLAVLHLNVATAPDATTLYTLSRQQAQERLDFLYESGLAVGKSSDGFQALQQSAPGAAAASTSAQESAADSSKVLLNSYLNIDCSSSARAGLWVR
ncbi:hypothetical protein Zm00014a_004519 [Zea mays]|uniref:Uncharacterized protein n=1 Tax=Zea mays TaxID=4577 RepID=A0A3L6FNR7_MAIZE|nr:hypothetical protein Zm00014a_004519 [Zea mays]